MEEAQKRRMRRPCNLVCVHTWLFPGYMTSVPGGGGVGNILYLTGLL